MLIAVKAMVTFYLKNIVTVVKIYRIFQTVFNAVVPILKFALPAMMDIILIQLAVPHATLLVQLA